MKDDCPRCGRCKSCGRSDYVPYGWPYGIWIYPQPTYVPTPYFPQWQTNEMPGHWTITTTTSVPEVK